MHIFNRWKESLLRRLPPMLVDLVRQMLRHRITSVGAEIAYFLLLSIFPLLICSMTLINFFPLQANALLLAFQPYMPQDVFILIEALMEEVAGRNVTGFLSLGLVFGLWFASRGIYAMLGAFNISYEVKETRSYFQEHLIAIVLTLTFIVIVILSLFVFVFGRQILDFLVKPFPQAEFIFVFLEQFRYLMLGMFLFCVFLILFYFGPYVRLRFQDVVPGALFTTVGWQIVSYGFSAYVDAYANYTRIYGSLSGIILLILWFYIIGMLVLMGCEFNAYLYASKNKKYQNLPKIMQEFFLKRNPNKERKS